MMHDRLLVFVPLFVMAVLSAGCQRQEQITQYTVLKPDALERSLKLEPVKPAEDREHAAPSSLRTERMLGAIVPQAERTWFFKLTGPDAAVLQQVEPFVNLIRSIRFPDGQAEPAWTLPADWKQEPGSGMRFATLRIPSKGEVLELTVIPLPSDGDSQAAALANVNRWRGQLSLAPTTQEALAKESVTVELEEGVKATVVNLVGKRSGNRMGAAPFAGGNARPPASPPAGPATASTEPASSPPPFAFKTPEGWKAGKSGGFRKAAFDIRRDNLHAEVTVIDLAAGAGELLPNINRWRGQVHLPAITQKELDASLQHLPIAGEQAAYVELDGPETEGRSQTILGAVLVRGERAWFFKLQGDSALAQAEKSRFAAFVKSIQFDSDGGSDGQ
jgi:hypothetical protein